MERRGYLSLTFQGDLHATPSGFSPGGAVFPREIVTQVGLEKRTLHLKWPDKLEIEKSILWLGYPNFKIAVNADIISNCAAYF